MFTLMFGDHIKALQNQKCFKKRKKHERSNVTGERVIEFREALREAMSEEMRKDNRVFLIGEEVAQYNGAYKVSKGMLDEFGPTCHRYTN